MIEATKSQKTPKNIMESIESFLVKKEQNSKQSKRYLSLSKVENNDSIKKLFDTLKENNKKEVELEDL